MSRTEATPTTKNPVWYEITVMGELGPVVRAAFSESRITRTERSTVLRLRCARELDSLVDLLRSRGLAVDDIRRISPITSDVPH